MTVKNSIITILYLIFIDQITKFLSMGLLVNRIPLLQGFLALDLQKNKGISLGLLSDPSYQIYLKWGISSVLLSMFLYFIFNYRKLSWEQWISMILIIAGGVSNQIDRLFFGAVTDFIEVMIFNTHLFTCNLADIYITSGVFLFTRIYSSIALMFFLAFRFTYLTLFAKRSRGE